mmetsp:Transcript_28241/g.39423  ORF Transcript_28241/g.39423 Transcript_28241/m.39423 type:complete len:91 (+) Transcript_28241:190-462(+)
MAGTVHSVCAKAPCCRISTIRSRDGDTSRVETPLSTQPSRRMQLLQGVSGEACSADVVHGLSVRSERPTTWRPLPTLHLRAVSKLLHQIP